MGGLLPLPVWQPITAQCINGCYLDELQKANGNETQHEETHVGTTPVLL